MAILDRFIEHGQDQNAKPITRDNIKLALRKLGTNKELRIFLTSICKYSKPQWADLLKTCRLVYSVLQSSVLIKSDSDMADEILKIPHIAIFFRRLTEEDVD
jgi:hypothetical protein